ncbi:isochorismate pyruvate lyase [Actinoplanes lutulentus]|uniref:Isochorismate pyruvate lyase n=1 Tax=Actinoplanes lutulentus TaxID=1287878 RepID=A0A327Z381_9ACTN|nr:chorismate mutase [Actinoplanes lutulentus]RAK29807.1 isochorismate pyruvate lyase [Actinoplanes lutulentus]
MPDSLADIRDQIDALDAEVVRHLAARERLVRRAAAFKTNDHAVRAPARVDQVIARVRALSTEAGASPDVAEQVYRAMISAFITLELAEHRATNL